METPMQLPIERSGKHTGWAIAVALVAAVFFYVGYRLLFTFIIGTYASYDSSFGAGFGALVLLVFGSNVLAFLSGAVVARKAFPSANVIGLFYGLATLLVALGAVAVLREIGGPDGNWVVAAVNVIVIAMTIFAVRVYLFSDA